MNQIKGSVKGILNRIPRNLKVVPALPRKEQIITLLCLTLVVVTAVLLRLQPTTWGYTLSEFDPFFQYENTKYIVDNGFQSFLDYHNYREWYPYGRDVGATAFPGLPFAGATVYIIATAFGLRASVMDVAIVFPLLAAALTCIVAYFIGKEIGGQGVGLISAFMLAVSPAYIERTNLGFYDDETVGILFILLAFLFYLRAMKGESRWRSTLVNGILAGLSLGFVFASWGASRYPLALLALFTFFLILVKFSGSRVLVSYGIMNAVGLAIAVMVPKLGFQFLMEFEVMASLGVVTLLLLNYLSTRLSEGILKKNFMPLSIIAILGFGLILWAGGIITLPGIKFISVLNPFFRSDIPLLASVQEHRPATWASYYYQFGQLLFLVPLGIVFALRRLTPGKLFVVSYSITTIYFSATLSRLTILAAPALAILGGLGLVELLRPFANAAFQRKSRRRARFTPQISRGFSIFFIAALFVLTFLPLGRGIDAAYSPTTIASSTIPVRAQIGDWMETLLWMKENLPSDAVVASWWDYGYWISIVGGKISLADNGTINSTQIANIGRMFMSNETDALVMLKEYDAEYVVIFTTIAQAEWGQFLFGDEVKWRWMAEIGWDNNTADIPLEDTTITSELALAWMQIHQEDTNLQSWYDQFSNYALPKPDTVLTKLMIYGTFPGSELATILEPEHFDLTYASTRRMVLVYRVATN